MFKIVAFILLFLVFALFFFTVKDTAAETVIDNIINAINLPKSYKLGTGITCILISYILIEIDW